MSTLPNILRTQTGNTEDSDKRPFTYANYLYIRYHDSVGDDRLTDGSLPPGTNFWESIDISFSPTDTAENPVLGTAITLQAVIHNDGFADAIDVFVEFVWFDPSLAIVEHNKQPIGTKIVSVPHDGYTVVTCPKPWIPTLANGGHECLVVQCSCPGEGKNGLKHPYNAGLDRHVAQRNVMLSPSGTPLRFALRAPNPFSVPTAFSVVLESMVVSADLRELQGLNAKRVLALVGNAAVGRVATPDSQRLDLTTFDVTKRDFGIRIADIRKVRLNENPRRAEKPFEGSQRAETDQIRGKIISEFELDRGEMAEMHVTIPPLRIEGKQFLVHRLTQVAKGIAVGGYTVIILPKGFSDH